MASSPITAANAGAAIIGDATACSINAKKRPGERACSPASRQHTPNKVGRAKEVHAVAVSTTAGLATYARKMAKSTRRNAMQSKAKIASVTNGFKTASIGGSAIAMKTIAAMARVPWRPSQAKADDNRVIRSMTNSTA